MAYEESLRSFSMDADSSVGIYTGPPGLPGSLSPNSGKQYHFVKFTAAGTVGLSSAAAHEIQAGVLQNKPQNVGDASTVGFSGISMVELGATVAAAVGVKADSTGRPITWVVGTDDVDLLVGVAVLGGDVGDLVPMQLLIRA